MLQLNSRWTAKGTQKVRNQLRWPAPFDVPLHHLYPNFVFEFLSPPSPAESRFVQMKYPRNIPALPNDVSSGTRRSDCVAFAAKCQRRIVGSPFTTCESIRSLRRLHATAAVISSDPASRVKDLIFSLPFR